MRQFFFSLIAIGVAVGIYFGLKSYVGTETVSWMCILGAAPFAALGFIRYHGMPAEKFVWRNSYPKGQILYYLTSPSKKMLKDMGIYEGDIDQIISVIGEDFSSIAELQQLLKDHMEKLGEISIVSRYIIDRLLN